MTPSEITSSEQRMQQKWHDLIMAEQKGASMPILEQMYNAYLVAVEEYNRSLIHPTSTSQAAAQPVTTPQVYAGQQLAHTFPPLPKTTPTIEQKRKKAS